MLLQDTYLIGQVDLLHNNHPEHALLQIILIEIALQLAFVHGHLQRVDGMLELAHVEVHLAQHEEDAEVGLLREVLGHDVVAKGVL